MLNLFTIKRLRVLPTQECNLNCRWCCKEGQFTKRTQISKEDFRDCIYFLSRFGLQEIKFSGGEPLLYGGLSYLVKETKKIKNIKEVSITTNGVCLEKRLTELESAGIDRISVTLNTLNSRVFENLCDGTIEDLESIVKGCALLSKSNIPKRSINFVVTNKNISEISSLLDFAEEYGFDFSFIRLINEIDPDKRYFVSPKELFDYLLSLNLKLEVPREYNEKSYSFFKIGDINCRFVNSACGENPACYRCDSFFIRLTSDGKLKPCLKDEQGEVEFIEYIREKKYLCAERAVKDVVKNRYRRSK